MLAKLFNDPGQLDQLWASSLRLLQAARRSGLHPVAAPPPS